MSEAKHSLTPAQIEYLKIGPKVCNSTESKKLLNEALTHQNSIDGNDVSVSAYLCKIPKFTFGGFQNTVNNFGVLINKNFGNESTLHQMQKFGKIAKDMNKVMQQQKDKPILDEKKLALNKKLKAISDTRTALKSIYDYQGHKLFLTLKSFTIESITFNKTAQTLPIPYLKFLVTHINSSKLVKTIQASFRQQGTVLSIEYDKLQGKFSSLTNNEVKYVSNQQYIFERSSQQLAIGLPLLEFYHIQSDHRQTVLLQNKDILQIIDTDFDNLFDIVKKYLDTNKLDQALGKTGGGRSSLPPLDEDEGGDGDGQQQVQNRQQQQQEQLGEQQRNLEQEQLDGDNEQQQQQPANQKEDDVQADVFDN